MIFFGRYLRFCYFACRPWVWWVICYFPICQSIIWWIYWWWFRCTSSKFIQELMYSWLGDDHTPHAMNFKPTAGLLPFQVPELEVRTVYKAYVRAKFQGICLQYGLLWYSTSSLGTWNGHWYLYTAYIYIYIFISICMFFIFSFVNYTFTFKYSWTRVAPHYIIPLK